MLAPENGFGFRPIETSEPHRGSTCGTNRLKPLKFGAQVRRSVRRIKVAMLAATTVARRQASGL